MTSIWYEVFPVTLFSKQVVLIQQRQEQQFTPWMIPNRPNIHPNQLVVQHLQALFDDIPGQTIVHSTSWRYEYESDRLLLTYLTVLPQGAWVDQLIAARGIYIEAVGALETQYGDQLFPPERIKQGAVLAHALDHLASLITYDPTIQSVLEPEWLEILSPRISRSAGCLQTCSLPPALAC
jgi:hypothetical protein